MAIKTLSKEQISKLLPKRPKDAHKGTFGKVLIIVGSKNYPGAAYLACAAAYRVGVGLISLATDETTKIIISKKIPEVTFLLHSEIYGKLPEYNVLLLGPGLGLEKKTGKFVEQLLTKRLPKTVVIDGDGLNILSKMGKWWERLKGGVMLTPHPGEMSRLTGLSIDEIQTDRINVAQYFAKKWNKIVVLKGANTVIVSPAGEVVLSPFANPALATAGTGDVLSGIIAGLIAQGLKLFDAACCGVYIHAIAGELISEKIGDTGMLASDLLLIIPKAMQNLKNNYST